MLKSLFKAIGLGLLLLLIYAVADFLFAFASDTRHQLNRAILLISGAYLLWLLVGLAFRSNRQMALRADRLLSTKRDTVFTAFELAREAKASEARRLEGGLGAFLTSRAIADGTSALRGLKTRQVFPADEIHQAFYAMLGVVAAIVLLSGMAWPIATVIAPRIASPDNDIPPYSPLRFAVAPDEASVDYGGNLLLSSEITGATIDEPVFLMTRDEKGEHESRCFSESGTVYVQRLERVIRPLEFSFRTGKARSKWFPVEVLLEPKVTEASVTVTPPQYSDLPVQEFTPGSEPLVAIPGSEVRLTLNSNRPLSSGRLQVLDLESETEIATTPAELAGTHAVTYTWIAKGDAYLRAHITDVRGTPTKEPLEWLQKIKPDAPPEATISEPSEFVLATPSVAVPLKGSARDDLGLRRVDIVKSIVGYRDRFETAGIVSGDQAFDFSSELQLEKIGVEPGQVIELYLEAADHNPSLTGVASSPISRVEIISEDEYAEMLRVRTTVAEFTERFRLMNLKLSELIDALEAIEERAHAEKREGLEALFDLARDKNAGALEIYEKLANDFAAFELEKGLIRQAGAIARLLRAQQLQISQLSVVDPELEEKARGMLDALGEHKVDLEVARKQAEQVSRIAALMELAARYDALVRDQEALVRRLEPFEKLAGDGGDTAKLKVLGAEEKRIRESLDAVTSGLREKASKLLAEEEAEFRGHANAFADRIDHYAISEDLLRAQEQAEGGEGAGALGAARLALEKMKRVIEETSPEGFGALCQGRCNAGLGKMPGLKETLEQMLSAIQGRFGGRGAGSGPGGFGRGMSPGRGHGTGTGGTGVGGNSESGNLMGGHSPLNVPVFGPDRLQLKPSDPSSLTGQQNAGRGPGSGGHTGAVESTRLPGASSPAPVNAETLPTERIPPRYREAVKRYFQSDSNDSKP